MKKLLFMALLLIAGHASFGQAGALTIANNNQKCGVYVTMYAEVIGSFPHCSLMSNTIYVPAATTVPYLSHGAFTTAVGWFSGGTPPATATTFRWNETQFQFDCPVGVGCSNGGTFMNSSAPGVKCAAGLPQTSVLSSAGGCVTNLSWFPAASTTMTNVTITFN